MSQLLSLWGDVLWQLMSFQLPYGISFGVFVVGIAFMPILFKALKTLLTSINIDREGGRSESGKGRR